MPRWFHAATVLKARLDLEVRRDSLSGRMLGPDAETVDSHYGDQNGDEGPDDRAQGCPFSDWERDKPWHFSLNAACALQGSQECRYLTVARNQRAAGIFAIDRAGEPGQVRSSTRVRTLS
jgi:hypothetical protein